MRTRFHRTSQSLWLGGVATFGLIAACSWPARAQAPGAQEAGAREQQRTSQPPAPAASSAPRPADSPTAGPRNRLPPGGEILLQRRRAEVSELEAAWAAELGELGMHMIEMGSEVKKATAKAEAEYQDSKTR